MIHNSLKKISLIAVSTVLLAGCGETDSSTTSADSPGTDAPGLSAEVATSANTTQNSESPTIAETPQKTAQEITSKLPKGWKTYESELGRFSIAMPGTPNQEDRPVELPGGGSVPLKIASLEKQNVAYFTGYVDYPEGLVSNPAINVQEVLSSSIEGATAGDFGGGNLTQNETSVNGVPCRDFKTSGKLGGTDALMEGVFCLEGDRLFEVLIIGADESGFSQKAQDFRNSFAIQKS